ncbi:cytochrome P450 6d1-like [Musca vetustissima]|uniref:cytochrome P450 6d1-like n=1 Tax=Musca vetustissima TaxID=27455 RepID=UPI002AB7235E|nr:cytochrome P450 6d1-like [Musca vetustissima]
MLLFIFILSVIIIYSIVKRHYSQWQRLGIATDDSGPVPLGCLHRVMKKEKPLGLVFSDIYKNYEEKIVGIYMLFKPAILVRDAALIRQIMTTDFGSFHDRGVYVDEKYDPLSSHLFNLKGQTWRTLRAKLTPSFSSGKLKAMFETVDEVGDKMIKHLLGQMEDGGTKQVDVKDLATTYAVDIIGSVIFGLELDSFSNPNNEFHLMSDGLFKNPKSNFLQQIRHVMNFICPPIAHLLCRLGVNDPITFSIRDIVQRTIEFREKNNVVRKDLLQLLIQLRNTGKISDDTDDSVWRSESAAENLKSISIDVIAANLLLFYIAGSETTSATIAFTLYELAMYPEILAKVQLEIDSTLAKHNLRVGGPLSYDALKDMKYLDLCVMETMRKYPGLPFLNRECTQDFQIPGMDFTIKRGTAIIIPLFGLHRDPEYFPQPMDYIPERFDRDIINYNPMAYMPFGEGPRHCIAQRMGVVNVKVALVKFLANFSIETMERKEVEFKFHTTPILLPKGGLPITIKRR